MKHHTFRKPVHEKLSVFFVVAILGIMKHGHMSGRGIGLVLILEVLVLRGAYKRHLFLEA